MIGQSPQEAADGSVEHAPDATPKASTPAASNEPQAPKEWGGREGPEPTRYGDWEKNGRCIDF